MSDLTTSSTVLCPSCWEPNTLTLDLSASHQTYIEDCEVCCNPMSITFSVEDGELVSIDSELAQ